MCSRLRPRVNVHVALSSEERSDAGALQSVASVEPPEAVAREPHEPGVVAPDPQVAVAILGEGPHADPDSPSAVG